MATHHREYLVQDVSAYFLIYCWKLSSFYYRENSQFIIKYNLLTSNIDNHITLSGYSPRSITYMWGGYSGVDLAVDENGLWVLWGNTGNGSRLSASKIEGDVIVNNYNLATGKSF